MPRSIPQISLPGLAAFVSGLAFVFSGNVHAEEKVKQPQAEPPVVYSDDFESGAEHWQPSDEKAWKIKQSGGDHGEVYSQFEKKSDYNPPHRSPFNISLLKDVTVGDMVLDVDVLSTHPDYGHRDAVVVFGYQDPAHFYYVHLGKKADDHANQIFIVNDAPRTKISLTSTDGTDWDDNWHHVRVVRRTKDGAIEIYYDDMQKPVMTAEDKHFLWGRIGLGTFDDTSDWDNLKLRGVKVEPKKADEKQQEEQAAREASSKAQ